MEKLLRAGADKVGVNTAAIARPELITEIAERFGAQVLVLSVDARRTLPGEPTTASGYEVTTHGGRRGTGLDAVEWAARAAELGAGEILLNSMDADGTKQGFDLEMLTAVRSRVTVPLVASGGAGAVEHFPPAVAAGADAVLAASVFHFGQLTVGEVKDALRGAAPRPLTTRPPRPGTSRGTGPRPRGALQVHQGPVRRPNACSSSSAAGPVTATDSAPGAPPRADPPASPARRPRGSGGRRRGP